MSKQSTPIEDQTRNLNPTAEAFVAMCIWGKEYSEQGGGSMDFWDTLSIQRKRQCKAIVDNILVAKRSRV